MVVVGVLSWTDSNLRSLTVSSSTALGDVVLAEDSTSGAGAGVSMNLSCLRNGIDAGNGQASVVCGLSTRHGIRRRCITTLS
jgi:hypothetical protein